MSRNFGLQPSRRSAEFSTLSCKCRVICGRPENMTPLNSSVEMSPYR